MYLFLTVALLGVMILTYFMLGRARREIQKLNTRLDGLKPPENTDRKPWSLVQVRQAGKRRS
jgi:hypothetical protein